MSALLPCTFPLNRNRKTITSGIFRPLTNGGESLFAIDSLLMSLTPLPCGIFFSDLPQDNCDLPVLPRAPFDCPCASSITARCL